MSCRRSPRVVLSQPSGDRPQIRHASPQALRTASRNSSSLIGTVLPRSPMLTEHLLVGALLPTTAWTLATGVLRDSIQPGLVHVRPVATSIVSSSTQTEPHASLSLVVSFSYERALGISLTQPPRTQLEGYKQIQYRTAPYSTRRELTNKIGRCVG